MYDEYIASREDYIGLGSGAFSYLNGTLFASTFSINHYKRLVASGKTGTVCRREMSERDQLRYFLLMQMFGGRLIQGAAFDAKGTRMRSLTDKQA